MIQKAGCILINKKKKAIGLIYRDTQNDFTFPKGHLEEGETLEKCAIRETAEETKRDCVILRKIDDVMHYVDALGDECECHYYLALDKGKSKNKSEDTHELVWIKFEEVEEKLTYESLKEIWRAVKNEIKEIVS